VTADRTFLDEHRARRLDGDTGENAARIRRAATAINLTLRRRTLWKQQYAREQYQQKTAKVPQHRVDLHQSNVAAKRRHPAEQSTIAAFVFFERYIMDSFDLGDPLRAENAGSIWMNMPIHFGR
jgi:hypothetical protein